MKKLLLASLLFITGMGLNAQAKSTGSVSLITGMTATLLLDSATTTATLTLTGPSDRWFALQFGTFADGDGMQSGQDMVYFNGTTLVDGTMNGIGAVPSSDTNNWTVSSNTVAGTIRTIVATRAFTAGANDYTFNYDNETIDFAYAHPGSAGFTLQGHGGNRGYRLGNTFSDVLATDAFSLEGLTVYPNPASGIVTVKNKALLSEVKVVNLLGQEVVSQKVNDTAVPVNISGLSIGTYVFKITAADGRTTSVKVVKQ